MTTQIQVGNVSDVSGKMNIAGGNIYEGYTAEQVSILLKQVTTFFQPKRFDGTCPYKGLEVFDVEDGELFFGREMLVDELAERVKISRALFITGPSGSGKSSLVRGGLIYALKNGKLKKLRSDRWLYGIMSPGRDPISELGRVASEFASSTNAADEISAKASIDASIFARWCEIALKDGRDKRAVLFVDQFEEVFTQVENEEQRILFFSLLSHAATSPNGRVILLLSMRSDFVSNCASYPQINHLLNIQFLQIGSMQPHELVSAIAQPALRVGLRIDPELVAQIINETRGEPGTLPLMQFALKDLFDAQEAMGGELGLTLHSYLQRGGIHKALERHADDVFAQLNQNEQELARSIFSNLVEIGRGTQDTRRTTLFEELISPNTDADTVKVIVQKLADGRLITTDEHAGKDTVTISHEKLIDAWPWLRKLVNENHERIRLLNEIASDAEEWEEHNRDVSYLYSGTRLAIVREKGNELNVGGTTADYLKASIAIETANRLSTLAISKKDSNFSQALLLAIEALHFDQNNATIYTMSMLLQAHPGLKQFLNAHSGAVTQVIWSPDRKLIASGGEDQKVRLWDITSQEIPKVIAILDNEKTVTALAFSPNGNILASGGFLEEKVILWDVSDAINVRKLSILDISQIRSSDPSRFFFISTGVSLDFNSNGRLLVASNSNSAVTLWDISDPTNPQQLDFHTDGIGVAFSHKGHILAAGDLTDRVNLSDISNPDSPAHLNTLSTSLSELIVRIAFSNDDQLLVMQSVSSKISIWDVSDLHFPQLVTVMEGGVFALRPDNQGLAVSNGSTINLYEISESYVSIRKLEKVRDLTGHSASVACISFGDNGETLISGGADSRIILWDLTESNNLIRHSIRTNRVSNMVINRDKGSIATSSDGSSQVVCWELDRKKGLEELLHLETNAKYVSGMDMNLSGTVLASISNGEHLLLWDIANIYHPKQLSTCPAQQSTDLVRFHPSGDLLATGDFQGKIALWDTRNPNLPRQVSIFQANEDRVSDIVITPDGKTLISGGYDGNIFLWDITNSSAPISLHKISIEETENTVSALSVLPDRNLLIAGIKSGHIMCWEITTPAFPVQLSIIDAHNDWISKFDYDDRTKLLAACSIDQNISVWDISNPRVPISFGRFRDVDMLRNVYWVFDDTTLLSTNDSGDFSIWNLSIDAWRRTAEKLVGRNLTRLEWAQYLPDEPYRASCSQWPLEP